MKKALVWSLALVILALPGLAAADHHQEKPAAAPAPEAQAAAAPAPAAPAANAAVRAEVLRQIDAAEQKLVALAEATPAEKYGWRPGDGVRSVGEVYLHVAGGNYFLPTFWGVKPPEGLDLRGIEKDAADKAKVVDALKKSFDHVRQAIRSLPDAELDKAIKLFGRDSTVREAALQAAVHAHEHLGQAIAYARMNGIVPPWSRQEEG